MLKIGILKLYISFIDQKSWYISLDKYIEIKILATYSNKNNLALKSLKKLIKQILN